MGWERFCEQYKDTFESPWEAAFVRDVLSRVPELNWTAVQPQKSFPMQGRVGRIDFAIEEPGGVRIAIEVHGYDKDGSGTLTREQFTERLNRGMTVQQAGWRLIDIPNRLVAQYPQQCARTVQLVLKRERNVVKQLRSQSSTISPDQLRRQALSATEADELEQLRETLTEELERLEAELEEQSRLRQVAETQRDSVAHDRHGMLRLARYFAVAVVILAGVVVWVTLAGRQAPPTNVSDSAATACGSAIPWSDARRHVGSRAVVAGPVVDGTYQSDLRGAPTFLNVGQPYPDPERFVVVIWGRDRKAFPQAPELLYQSEQVAVAGQVEAFEGRPQIVVDSPEDIDFC